MFKLDRVTKEYVSRTGITTAVSDISFTIKKGEIIAIVGASGSGKTTLLRMMAGLEQSSSGTISLGKELLKEPTKSVGIVLQHATLFPWLTVEGNIESGLRLSNTKEPIIKKLTTRYLNLVGLSSVAQSYPWQLSGGMQQRVSIARTLVNNPSIVLLDEPFGALDVQTRFLMEEFLAQLWEEEQKTMVLVTHDIEEALYVADRIVVLGTKPGRIKDILSVNLPRPRRSEMRYSEEFTRMKKYISYMIRSEYIKAAVNRETVQSRKETLVIGTNIWPGIAPLYFGKERGIFTSHNLDVEVVGYEWSDDRLKPLRDGTVDAMGMTLDTAILACHNEPTLRILMPLDYSNGGDALLAQESITSIKELRGKKVGLEVGGISHFFLYFLLHQAGLSGKDVQTVDVKGSALGDFLISKKIDAGILWEPWLSKAREYAKVLQLASSKEYPPLLYAVLVVSNEVLEQKRDSLNSFKNAWKDIMKQVAQEGRSANKVMAPYLGISERELEDQLKELVFVDSTHLVASAIKIIQEVLFQEGLIQKKLSPKDILF
ncbi:MAG: ATP-binding cassette domain-containing protein [Patescibacteria group bacterium]